MLAVIPSKLTPEEHYARVDEAVTDCLRAGKAEACNELLDALWICQRVVKIALGLPIEDT